MPKWVLFTSPRKRQLYEMIQKTVWQGVFDGRFEDREFAISVFENHIKKVKSVIPKDRLLIHEAKDGWKPLCDFLDKPIPDQAYPRVNEAASFKTEIEKIKWLRRLPWVLLFVAIAISIYLF